MYGPFLPPELWDQIFYWATYGPARDQLLTVPYFDSIRYIKDEKACRDSLSTKYSISLVCRQWHGMSSSYLYEDIHIRYGARSLLKALRESDQSKPGDGYGRLVRRIVLSTGRLPPEDEEPCWATPLERRIIRCCPNVVTLSRYRERYPMEDGDEDVEELDNVDTCDNDEDEDKNGRNIPLLHSVRRIDWSNGVAPDRPRVVAPAPLVTWLSDTLEVLSLGGDNLLWSPLILENMKVVRLPRVHTLRIDSSRAFGVPGVFNYEMDLPSLRRVILDRPDAFYGLIMSCIAKCGKTVKVVEIGAHWRFLRSDYVSTLIAHCPNIEMLLFPVFWTHSMRWRRLRSQDASFAQLKEVGLHCAEGPETTYTQADWMQVEGHFKVVLESSSETNSAEDSILRMPNLRVVKLYGTGWGRIIADKRFPEILDIASGRGVALECDDIVASRYLRKVMEGRLQVGEAHPMKLSSDDEAPETRQFRDGREQ